MKYFTFIIVVIRGNDNADNDKDQRTLFIKKIIKKTTTTTNIAIKRVMTIRRKLV